MIESRNDIMPLLNEYTSTQHEFGYQRCMGSSEEWSTERQVMYTYGVVLGKYQEKDELTMKVLKEDVSEAALIEEIRLNCTSKIRLMKGKEYPDIMDKMKLVSIERQLQELMTLPIDIWIETNWTWVLNELVDVSTAERRVLLYLYYAFENYNHTRNSKFNSDIDCLSAVYGPIFGKNSQFGKYGIVPIDQNRKLIPIDPPRIYDESIYKTFSIKNIPIYLVEQFSKMMSEGMIIDLAVRLKNEPGCNGKMDSAYLAEAFERGKQFDLVNLGNYSVSKLYSNKYEDSLWVVIEPEDITFEELCDDFESYEDMIVTQVVHLQYKRVDDVFYITHLDHEYIFYTMEEYTIRMSDVKQEGTAQTRIKSFKIDNSRIPFDYMCEVHRRDDEGNDLPVEKEQFLCYVLECYFKHKDLLVEYFEKLLI